MYHGRLFYWSDLLFVGTYIPRKEVVVDETIRATIIKPNQAIKLRARKETLVSVHDSISTFRYCICMLCIVCLYACFLSVCDFMHVRVCVCLCMCT